MLVWKTHRSQDDVSINQELQSGHGSEERNLHICRK